MEDEKSEQTQNNLAPPEQLNMSRRDFLRIGGLTALYETLPQHVKRSTENQKNKEQRVVIETDNAVYLPFYEESHFKRITIDELKAEQKTDYFFFEFAINPGDLQNSTLQQIAVLPTNLSLASPLFNNPREIPLSDKLLKSTELEYFRKNGTALVFEGLLFPEELYRTESRSELFKLALNAALVSTTGGNIIRKIYKDEPLNHKDAILSSLAALTTTWEVSNELSQSLSQLFERPHKDKKSLDRIAQRISNLISHLHPEELHIYLRDIFMARKLQLIAEYQKSTNIDDEDKTVIGFQVHTGHGGIEDFLKIEQKYSLIALELMSNRILSQLVEANGEFEDSFEEKVRKICTTFIFNTNPNNDTPIKHKILDEDLYKYLLIRLSLRKNKGK